MAGRVVSPPTRGEQKRKMSYEEYLEMPGHAEWVDGEVTIFMPPSERHQDLVGFLYVLLSWYGRSKNLGKALFAPFEMRLLSKRVSREPDVVFIRYPWENRLDGMRLEGPADIAVELISDSSVTRDRRDKYAEYQDVGIPEYWLIDVRDGKWSATFYQLNTVGEYEVMPLDAQGRFHSEVLPGFWLDPAWFWEGPLPDPIALLPIIAADREGNEADGA